MARKKWKGYARAISGYGGEKYALFVKGKRTGTSTMHNGARHREELRRDGYRIMGGSVAK